MRREMQSLTLEALFEAIFRVLKHSTASGAVMTSALGALPARIPRRSLAANKCLQGFFANLELRIRSRCWTQRYWARLNTLEPSQNPDSALSSHL